MAVDPQPAADRRRSRFDPSRSARTAANYLRSETSDWLASQAAAFWESLDETWKEGFLAMSVSDLDVFSRGFLEVPWLGDFLWHAVTYFKLHDTWEVYVCPKPGCIRFFKEDHSLIAHLKHEHIPDIHGVNAWPFLQKDTAEEGWCSKALRRMVWKPIDMDGALNLLSTMCLDGDCATMVDIFDGSDLLCSLEWPLSDDPARSKLLARLGEGFQSLLAEQERSGFSLLSNDHFTMLTALASKHVLVYMPPRNNVLFLGNLLAHSALSFCFLDERSLSLFVELVSKMCHLVIQSAQSFLHEESSNNDNNWNRGEILDAISFSPDNNFFALDHAKADKRGLPALLSSAPCCPLIAKVPSKAVQIFHEIEMKLQLFHDRLHDFNMQLPGFTGRIRSIGLICSSGCCKGCQLKYETLQFLPKVWHPEISPVKVNLLKEKVRAGFRYQPLCLSCPSFTDIQRHCAQTCLGNARENLWKGIDWFRLNRTWKYWCCYSCDKVFLDQESHMVHMEFEHQICPFHDEYWLIPVPVRQDVVESEQHQLQHGPLHDDYSLRPRSVKQDDLNGDLGLEDSITVDHSCTYFLVDSSKFFQMPSTKEGEEFGCDKRKIFNETVQLLQNQLSHLRSLFAVKRKLLKSLEALCAFSCVLLNGNHPLRHLISLLDKFFSLDLHTETTSLFQISLCRLSQSHATLSNQCIEEACGMIKDDLFSKLDDLDHEILQILSERRKLNGLLYDLCVCDYRMNILPHVKSFIHAKFALDEDLQSLVCTTIEGLLSSIGAPYVIKSESFSSVPISLGKVFINMNGEESGLGFAYL